MKLTSRTVEFADTAPLKIEAERNIDATPAEVFDVIADTPGFADWIPAIKAAEWTSNAPYGVGSTRRIKAAGATLESRIIAWDPGQQWGFTVTRMSLPLWRGHAEVADLSPNADGTTHVRWRVGFQPTPLITRLIRGWMESELAKTLDALAGVAAQTDRRQIDVG